MSATLIRKTWWACFRYHGRRIRKRSPENSRAGAQAYEAVLRQRIGKGEDLDGADWIKKPKISFVLFAKRWFETYVKTNNKLSTHRSKTNALYKHLIPAFGKLPLDQITILKIEEFKATKLQSGLAPKSINNLLTVLRKCLTTAQEWEELATIPRVNWLRVPPQKYDFLSLEESDQLLRAADDPLWHDMILCALRTGMRLGEICALGWEDVNLESRTVVIRRSLVEGVIDSPKNNRIRSVPISDDLYIAFMRRGKKAEGFVFAHPDGNHMRKSSWPWKELKRVCLKAGLRTIGWHTLRHTFASDLIRQGAAMRAVQLLMGHCTIQMTERYSHLSSSDLRETINLLPKASFWESGQQVANTSPSSTVRVM